MTDCAQHTADRMVLFPGGSPWRGNWRSDIIRSNKSIAYVEFTSYAELGQTELHGWLDRKNINDRPSASISTTGANNHWNLDGFDALELELGKSDGKVYTIALDDQSGVTWEAKFRHENIKGLTTAVNKVIRFRNLKPRGYNADAVAPPDMGNIRKFELSFPSMDGKQEGSFMISIASISAVRLPCECAATLDPKLDEPLKGLEYAWEKVKYRTSALAFKLHLKRPKPRLRKRRQSFWLRSGRRP